MNSTDRQIAVSCGVTYKGYIWAPGDLLPVLYKINIKTNKVECVAKFLIEDECTFLYEKIIAMDDKLYLMPRRAKHMAVYNICTADIEYFEVTDMNRDSAFGHIRAYKNKIYLFPASENAIVIVDVSSKTIERINIRNEIFSKYNYDDETLLFICGASLDNKVYLPLYRKGIIVVFNCDDNKINYIKMGTDIEGIRTISVDNESIIFSDLSGSIWKFCFINSVLIQLMSSRKKESPFITQINYKNCYFFIPAENDPIISYNKQKKCFISIHVDYTCRDEIKYMGMAKYAGAVFEDNKIYILPRMGNEFPVIDVKILQVHYIDTCVSSQETRDILVSIYKEKLAHRQLIINEDEMNDIYVLIQAVGKTSVGVKHFTEVGYEIYSSLL
jgi:hypothetical protein